MTSESYIRFLPGARSVVFHLLRFSATAANNLGPSPCTCAARGAAFLSSQLREMLMTQHPTEAKRRDRYCGIAKIPPLPARRPPVSVPRHGLSSQKRSAEPRLLR